MIQRFILLLLSLSCMHICYAQVGGCFSKDANNKLQLQTNIDFSKYKSFFVGEFHGVYGVPEVKLSLIKYVHEHNDVSDIFMEIGHSTAWLYNSYLETGDTTLFTAPILTYAQKQPNRDFWKELYNYNKSLKHKLTIHGMDFERLDFMKTLKLLMPAGKAKVAQISGMLGFIEKAVVKKGIAASYSKEHYDNARTNVYDSVRLDIEKNRDAYKKYYGKNFAEVERIMFNENTFERYADRNTTMYGNVIKTIKEQKIKRFILFCGMNHADMEGSYTLCAKLMSESKLKESIATISMLCNNCYDWQQKPEHRNDVYRGPVPYVKDTVLLSSIYQQYYNADCKYTLLPAAVVTDKKVRAFSDYIILMKDQPEF